MIDKELIGMSDCPEIQEHKPDFMDSNLIFTQIVTKDGGMTSAYHCDRGVFMDGIYIPRIEDVLEWLTDEQITIDNQAMWNGSHWHVSTAAFKIKGSMRKAFSWETNCPVKALLKAFMHLEHNKTWSGEAWV